MCSGIVHVCAAFPSSAIRNHKELQDKHFAASGVKSFVEGDEL